VAQQTERVSVTPSALKFWSESKKRDGDHRTYRKMCSALRCTLTDTQMTASEKAREVNWYQELAKRVGFPPLVAFSDMPSLPRAKNPEMSKSSLPPSSAPSGGTSEKA